MTTILIYWLIVSILMMTSSHYLRLYLLTTDKQRLHAIRKRNLAFIFGFLCIILIIAFFANKDEFPSSINHKQLKMKEQLMQNDAFITIQAYGPLEVSKGVYS